MGERAEQTFKEVGIFTAKEAGQMFAFAKAGKWLSGNGRFFGFAGKEVSFGRNANQLSHTFRHVERAGLNRSSVQRAVQADLRQSASQIVAGKPFNQTIDVGGTRVTYTAFRLGKV